MSPEHSNLNNNVNHSYKKIVYPKKKIYPKESGYFNLQLKQTHKAFPKDNHYILPAELPGKSLLIFIHQKCFLCILLIS